jgi:hypothetical protein
MEGNKHALLALKHHKLDAKTSETPEQRNKLVNIAISGVASAPPACPPH